MKHLRIEAHKEPRAPASKMWQRSDFPVFPRREERTLTMRAGFQHDSYKKQKKQMKKTVTKMCMSTQTLFKKKTENDRDT
jgi:hypothetical protein